MPLPIAIGTLTRVYFSKIGVYTSILSQALREGCELKSFCLPPAKD